jgi:hypothetical protein
VKEWFSVKELVEAKLPGVPADVKHFDRFVAREGMRSDLRFFRRQTAPNGGLYYEYHLSSLPDAARQKLAFMMEAQTPKTDRSKAAWAIYERLTTGQKTECERRLKVLLAVETMIRDGATSAQAMASIKQRFGVARSTYHEWRGLTEGHARQDWIAALAPATSKKAIGVVTDTAEVHPMAWDVLVSDYLRPEGSAFSACYRRMKAVAEAHGWAPIPHERTLRRHMDLKIPKAVQILSRKGKEEARKLIPAQQRSVSHLHAMQYVNTDGHKLDLHVQFEDGRQGRLYLVGTQCLYSRKILSWVLTEAETWEAVRTVIGNMVEQHGIPERLYMDNGKAFASKKISGGAKSRHRFKITEDEVAGLLQTLGIDGRFVKPRRGQSKPVERAWGDLAENISKHPDMAGAYTGRSTQHKPENYGQRAIPVAELEAHVARQVAEHNARPDRKTETAKGRSFDQVFEASMETHGQFVRFASPAQRSLWMLAAEQVTARKPDGAIHLFGNRYHQSFLNQWIGRKVTVRFDPADLHGAIKVYDPEGRFLGEADCVAKVGFDCQASARERARAESDHMRSLKAQKTAARRLTDLDLKDLNAKADKMRPQAKTPKAPTVTRLVTRSAVLTKVEPAVSEEVESFDDKFNAGIDRILGDADIILFPNRE